MNTESTILITGAAGLLGQNLITSLIQEGYNNIIAIDKHKANLARLQTLHPFSQAIEETFCHDKYSKIVLERTN